MQHVSAPTRPAAGLTFAGRESDRPVAWLLRFLGVIDLLALGAVFMPETWMAYLHHAMGLGQLPTVPLVDYLTRSASLLYAVHGSILVLVSLDINRYRPLILFVAWVSIVHGAMLWVIDLWAGLPWWWTWTEGPIYSSVAALVLVLLPKESQPSTQGDTA